MMTRKDLRVLGYPVVDGGYCSHYAFPTAHKVGYNAGTYGWNWSAYLAEIDGQTFILLDSYRNGITYNASDVLINSVKKTIEDYNKGR